MDLSAFDTLRVRDEGGVLHLQLYRPHARNTINAQMVEECHGVLDACEAAEIGVVVVEGLPGIFCFGADFGGLRDDVVAARGDDSGGQRIYDLWTRLATGPFVSIAHVQGSVNAGGVGFVAACDIVIAESSARFSLSELLFGLYPACVMPFLVRRVGMQRARYLTLSTAPVTAEEACRWGLVDRLSEPEGNVLVRHLQRLRRLRPDSVGRYKSYIAGMSGSLADSRAAAVANNRDMHAQPGVIEGIVRFVETGHLPWE